MILDAPSAADFGSTLGNKTALDPPCHEHCCGVLRSLCLCVAGGGEGVLGVCTLARAAHLVDSAVPAV